MILRVWRRWHAWTGRPVNRNSATRRRWGHPRARRWRRSSHHLTRRRWPHWPLCKLRWHRERLRHPPTRPLGKLPRWWRSPHHRRRSLTLPRIWRWRHLGRRPDHRRRRVRHRRSRKLRARHLLWLHHTRRGPTHAADRPSKARLCLYERRCRNPSAGSAANAGSRQGGSADSLGAGLFGRRWALHSHGDDLFSAEEDKAECASVLALLVAGLLAFGGGKFAELLAVAEDEVHVAVEGHELPHQLPPVLDCDPHPVIDVLEHLRTLRHRHCYCFFCEGLLYSGPRMVDKRERVFLYGRESADWGFTLCSLGLS